MAEPRDFAGGRRAFVWLLGLTVTLGVLVGLRFDRPVPPLPLAYLTNFVGPTTASVLRGEGMLFCTDSLGTPGNAICFHAGRMPLPTLVIAAGERMFGDSFLRVGMWKLLLLLLPLEAGLYLVCLSLPGARWRRTVALLLLVAPFGMSMFLADLVNLQVEEGYAYSLLALAAALALFGGTAGGWLRRGGVGAGALMGFATAGLYLSKSSLAPAAVVLLVAFALREKGYGARVLALVLFAAAPLGWALHQHHVSGRYSLGTSVDGINFHKGENPDFLAEYPPKAGESLDQFDSRLNAGQYFADEWSFNDFHQRAAVAFMKGQPAQSLRGDLRKLQMIFFSVRKSGSQESHGAMLMLETAGVLLFRLIFWAALGLSAVAVWRRIPGVRGDGALFLLLVAAVALPYTLGFAYTRHVSVLVYPAVFLCCRMLSGWWGGAVTLE